MCHFPAYIYVCVSHIHHEFFWQSNLTSQDLSFIGYTYKNFEAVKGLQRQSLGKWFCFILEIIQLLYFYFIIFHPVEMFGFLRRMFRPCKTLLPPYKKKKKMIDLTQFLWSFQIITWCFFAEKLIPAFCPSFFADVRRSISTDSLSTASAHNCILI